MPRIQASGKNGTSPVLKHQTSTTSGVSDTGYFTKQQLCEFLDITPAAFDSQVKPKITAKYVLKSTRPFRYFGRAAVDTFVGGVGGALEKFRTERYRLTLLDRLEREESLVPSDGVLQLIRRLTTMLKDASTQLAKNYDDSASELLNQVIEAFQSEVEELWESTLVKFHEALEETLEKGLEDEPASDKDSQQSLEKSLEKPLHSDGEQ